MSSVPSPRSRSRYKPLAKHRDTFRSDYGEHVSNGGVTSVDITDKEIARKGKIAERLSRLTGGMVKVYFSPSSFNGEDEPTESQGHLFWGYWSPPNESTDDDGDTFNLDDRNGPLEIQLADEMLRLAGLLTKAADKLADKGFAAIAKKGGKAVANG